MNILVTNDDGILALDFSMLADICREVGDVTVVAPGPWAAAPALPDAPPAAPSYPPAGWGVANRRYADRSRHARVTSLDARAAGLRRFRHQSWTRTWARTYCTRARSPRRWKASRSACRVSPFRSPVTIRKRWRPTTPGWSELLRQITSVPDFPRDILLNINLPRVPANEVQGVRVTKLGSRFFSESITRMQDPWGREIFDRRRHDHVDRRRGFDHRAVAEGYISVTPLHMDLTNYPLLETVQGWYWRSRRGRQLRRLSRPSGGYAAGQRHSRSGGPACVRMVPRHLFVPDSVRHRAYDDVALPIGSGQTISQPYVQALYMELLGLKGREKVLEIGTGSGYQTALLALLADAVFSVERIPVLAERAKAALAAAGVRNVTVLVGDGTLGWRPFAPYDAILVAAASPDIPGAAGRAAPAPGGTMIIPVGDRAAQVLTVVERRDDGIHTRPVSDVRFVPLLGEFGFR